ncbi:dephospho-CoA kinase [Escherichia coli]
MRLLISQLELTIDADIIARQVVEPGAPALHAIADHFGANMIAADGTLQRLGLARADLRQPGREKLA